MAASILNKIEYLVLLVAAFAAQSKVSEAEAYRYLSRYGAISITALCTPSRSKRISRRCRPTAKRKEARYEALPRLHHRDRGS